MTIIISFGKNGGFYIERGWSFRICLWCIALTIMPRDIDELLIHMLEPHEMLEGE